MQIVEAIFSTGRVPEGPGGRAVRNGADAEFIAVFDAGALDQMPESGADLPEGNPQASMPSDGESAIRFAEVRVPPLMAEVSFPPGAELLRERVMSVLSMDVERSRTVLAAAGETAVEVLAPADTSGEMAEAVEVPVDVHSIPVPQTVQLVDALHLAAPATQRDGSAEADPIAAANPGPEAHAHDSSTRVPAHPQSVRSAVLETLPAVSNSTGTPPEPTRLPEEVFRAGEPPGTTGRWPVSPNAASNGVPISEVGAPAVPRNDGEGRVLPPAETALAAADLKGSPEADGPRAVVMPRARPEAVVTEVGVSQPNPAPALVPEARIRTLESRTLPRESAALRFESQARSASGALNTFMALSPAAQAPGVPESRELHLEGRVSASPERGGSVKDVTEATRSEPATPTASAPPRLTEVAQFLPQSIEVVAPGDVPETIALRGSEPPGPSAGTAPVAPPDPDVRRAVLDQLIATVRSTNAGAVEILLSPEELGQVRLDMKMVDGVMTVRIDVERPETLDLMRRGADVLFRELREAGFGSLDLSFGSGTAQRGAFAPSGDLSAQAEKETPPVEHVGTAPANPLRGLGPARLDIRI